MNARHKRPHRLALLATSPVVTGEAKIEGPRKGTETILLRIVGVIVLAFKNQNPARGRSVPPASPARAGEGDRVSGGGGAMGASCKPS